MNESVQSVSPNDLNQQLLKKKTKFLARLSFNVVILETTRDHNRPACRIVRSLKILIYPIVRQTRRPTILSTHLRLFIAI